MISLDKEQTCLLELIKSSLFEITPGFPESVDWDKVFVLAKTQCIVPLVAAQVPEEYRNEWQVLTCQSKAHFMRVLYEQNSLSNLLKINDIPFVILKGTAAAIYFPVPSLRTFGDVDFFISEENLDFARRLLEGNGYILTHNNERHFGYEKNGIEFELHFKYSSGFYNDIDHIIIKGLNNTDEYKIGNTSFFGLPTYENGLVLLGHIMQHLKTSGIGLRQIIDWMMFVHKELNYEAWNNNFRSLAAEAGLEKLAITVTYICEKWLGLPDDVSWCNSVDEEVAEQLFFRIMDEGNFGSDRANSEFVKVSMKREGTFKYLQRSGLINWPLAQKYAVFRPFAWLYQLCRYVCKGIVGVFTGKKVFLKGNYMSVEELWKRLE
ncbi:putative nucleotidyltransferase-like protein [Ruminococcaceae bacterium R-25]|nr:putative nucleotidyltransferase-like protein [Ruminococcaceae bacterium R-25]SUQ11314.1 Uncharacterised nucleotidyltransferase [Oscillospiraceae bacterium]